MLRKFVGLGLIALAVLFVGCGTPAGSTMPEAPAAKPATPPAAGNNQSAVIEE
jgi:hypothetical protein